MKFDIIQILEMKISAQFVFRCFLILPSEGCRDPVTPDGALYTIQEKLTKSYLYLVLSRKLVHI